MEEQASLQTNFPFWLDPVKFYQPSQYATHSWGLANPLKQHWNLKKKKKS